MPSPYERYRGLDAQEISSTGGGRHVTLSAGLINHPGAAVAAYDPVTFGTVADGYGVGVALGDEVAATDLIAIDTEGIWNLSVVATDDEGNSAIEIGDVIYINRTTCILSKISSDTTNLVFGYAMDTLAEGSTATRAIKVHWAPHRDDVFRDFLAAGPIEDAQLIDVDDAGEVTGISRGLYVVYRTTGDKPAGGESDGVGVDMFIGGDADYAYPFAAYLEGVGNPAIAGLVSAFSCYIGDLGDAIGNLCAVDIGMGTGANSPVGAGRHSYVRMRNHSAGSVPDAAFLFEGAAMANADYFCSWETVNLPIVVAAVGGVQTHKIRVRAAGVDYFIPLNTA